MQLHLHKFMNFLFFANLSSLYSQSWEELPFLFYKLQIHGLIIIIIITFSLTFEKKIKWPSFEYLLMLYFF